MKCLVVIDVQNDFVTGSLGTAEAVEMLPRLLEKMRSFEGAILMTIDTHEENYLDTQEGRMLPVKHCIMGTEGWRFPEEVNALRESRARASTQSPPSAARSWSPTSSASMRATSWSPSSWSACAPTSASSPTR